MTKNNFARVFAVGAVAALALTGCQDSSEDPIVDGTQVSVEAEAPEETAN